MPFDRNAPQSPSSLNRPPLDVHVEPVRHGKEAREDGDGLVGVRQLKLKVAQEPRDDLVDLEEGQVAPDADVGAAAELPMS